MTATPIPGSINFIKVRIKLIGGKQDQGIWNGELPRQGIVPDLELLIEDEIYRLQDGPARREVFAGGDALNPKLLMCARYHRPRQTLWTPEGRNQ